MQILTKDCPNVGEKIVNVYYYFEIGTAQKLESNPKTMWGTTGTVNTHKVKG